ncbi:MAG: hypothetical protein MUO26_15895 [Methanotrichaceae archaeon]|nr:hypothetical protein [Methanotrichaceae archaeon]
MTGLDYSYVREPEYDAGRFVQSEKMVTSIESTIDKLWDIWDQRDDMVQDALSELEDFYRRRKRIFYDTDMITENQEESVRLCEDCLGYKTISSTAQRGYGILNNAYCISIPRNALALHAKPTP